MRTEPRAIVVVLDSVGAGALPDADQYGDAGSNTIGHTAEAVGGLSMPNLGALGLGNVTSITGVQPNPSPMASWGRCGELSPGKDTTTGHWEMMGVVLRRAFPTYPNGFPREVLDEIATAAGRGWVGNYTASGTVIIQELGDEHVRTGDLIIYTSADSVLQIAAHEDVVPIEELYRICEAARGIMRGDHCVARIIARPFVGPDDAGQYVRTHRRRDFAIDPFEPTVLARLKDGGHAVLGVGKIGDIFNWQAVDESPHVTDNMDGFDKLVEAVASEREGFVFANLVDFDMLWGHRNDVVSYARGLEAVDARVPELLEAMIDGDLLIITSDHGCDPTTPSTDHSREYSLLLAKVKGVDRGVSLGVRSTFGDIGETVLEHYGMAGVCGRSMSFLREVRGA